MVALLLLVALVNTSPAASPTPMPPLHEIMHVRSSALCGEFATHANSAISDATGNDTTLVSLINVLGRSTMDQSTLAYNNELLALEHLSDHITSQWHDGEREVGQIRSLASKSTDPKEKLELTASANALGGALWRQRRIARDLDGFIAYLETEQMMANSPGQQQANLMLFGTDDPTQIRVTGERMPPGSNPGLNQPPDPLPFPGDPNNPKPGDQALAAAKDFSRRLIAIGNDEIQAAVHIEQASEGC